MQLTMDKMAQYLSSCEGLSVVALQEARDGAVIDFMRGDGGGETGSTLEYMGRKLDMNHTLFGPAWDNFGNAIISKYALGSSSMHTMKLPNVEARILCCAVLRSPASQTFGVFCTHLVCNTPPFYVEYL